MDIVKTKITTTIGMSVCLPNGDWVKSGHEVMCEVNAYPTAEDYAKIAQQELADATVACNEQIELLHKRING